MAIQWSDFALQGLEEIVAHYEEQGVERFQTVQGRARSHTRGT